MSISAPFIRRPVATTLLTIAVALSGIIAFELLPVAALPQIDFPTIQVSAALPGASPETMASAVAAPLERQFGRIAGVTEMTSTSFLGTTSIVLQFELDRNVDGAARDVQAAINAARGYLPPNLPNNPSYRKVNPADAPILIFSLTSDTMSPGQLYDTASTILQQRLSEIDGVGQVFVGGGSLPAVRIDLDPSALSHHGVGLEDVRAVISSTHVRRPKGQVTDGRQTWEIETNDQLHGADDFRPLIVRHTAGGALRLGDIASVEDSVEDLRAAGSASGKTAILVVLFRSPGANIIDTVDRVRAVVPQLAASLPGAADLAIVLDRTPPIRASLHDVEVTLVIATLLVILVVFAFLRNVRAALIPTVAVPVSLIGTFGAMYLFGYSLDNLSLMALTIATGFVVDDAIVVLENIARYIEAGEEPRAAALRGAHEIGSTVVSMSVSLVAVFLPILLMGGMVGRLFREFAVTLSVAVAISLVVSLTTTPMMCGALLRPGMGVDRHPLARAIGRGLERMTRGYERSLGWVLRHPRTTLAVTVLTVGLNVLLFMIVPKGFFPQQDTGRLTGAVQASQDISFQAMWEKLQAIVGIIGRDPAVDNVLAFTGGSGGGGGAKNTARMFIALKPPSERAETADEVIARLRAPLASVPGAPTFLQPVQDLRIGGRASSAQYQYALSADNVGDLTTWAPRLVERLRRRPELADVNSDQQIAGLQATIAIDRDTASRLHVSSERIDDTLYDAFGQRQVAVTYSPLNQYHVVMEVAPRFWQRPETLRDIYVNSSDGVPVPLSAFAHYAVGPTTLSVNHSGQFPSVTLSFNLAAGFALSDAVRAVDETIHELAMPSSIHGSFQGTAQAFQASLASEPFLVLAALVAVYIVLGVLYESYIHPITILSTLPSAGVGAILALLLCRTDLSVIALIGIILLIGIVKKNAIMMIDFALVAEREHQKTPADAIFEASLLRFRPIMMTTLAALFGALPLALNHGSGAELRRPLGIAIVGGLIVSQALTLYTTPVVYLYLDRLALWWKRTHPVRAPRMATTALLLVAFATLAGCSVGPRYVRPAAPESASYKELDGWKVAQPGDATLRGDWWELFGDPALSALEEQVAAANQNVIAAEARFREARALVSAARASWYPTVTIGASATRSRAPSSTTGSKGRPGTTFSDYAMPLTVSWEIDVWGRIRRLVESNAASAQASAADLESTRLSLQGEAAVDYFQLRDLDGQRELLQRTIQAFGRSLQLTRDRHDAGVASAVDVVQAESQLETVRAQEIDLGLQRAQLEHALAVLTGVAPSSFTLPPKSLTATPPPVPVGLPSELLERRPDVAAAERRVAAANAQIGAAEAAYYPTVTLGASGGFESSDISRWFVWPSRFWSVGPSISETVFDGGLRSAQTRQARAIYDETVADYRQSVLAAFQEVEDNLAALRMLEQEARVQDAAVRAAEESVRLTIDQYKAGTASYLNVIVTQADALAAERTAVDLLGRRMSASVLLIEGLGGGWSDRALPSTREVSAGGD